MEIQEDQIHAILEEELTTSKELHAEWGMLKELKVQIQNHPLNTMLKITDNCNHFPQMKEYSLCERVSLSTLGTIIRNLLVWYPKMLIYDWEEDKIAFKFHHVESKTYQAVLFEIDCHFLESTLREETLEFYKRYIVEICYPIWKENSSFQSILSQYFRKAKEEDLPRLKEKELDTIFQKLSIEEKRHLLCYHLSDQRYCEVKKTKQDAFLKTIKRLELENK